MNLSLMRSHALALLISVCSCMCACAQTPHAASNTTHPGHVSQEVVVLGSAVPVPLAESPRSVMILPLAQEKLALATPIDRLRSDPSVFIEQRGAGGAQDDILLRGGSFEQTLILVNGFRIDDSQTAHHNLDLPIPLDAMNSIQILHGAGSTLHGADALSGAVDFLTAAPSASSLAFTAGVGNFGSNEQSAQAELVRRYFSSRLTASHNLSTGFIADRDYRNEDAALESWLSSRLGLTDLLVAASDRSFGASQFYGPYDSWERTKGWFASARQELGSHAQAAFGYRRHTDEFVLVRDNPALYENNHVDGSWQASLRGTLPIRAGGLALLGLEADGDSIVSNNLGRHARNRGAGYVDLDLHPKRHRWTLSAGLREEGFSGSSQYILAPHLAGSLRIANSLKLRASSGYGFRIPTYTDLYYSDPVTLGNPNLKPESAWSGDSGMDWTPGRRVSLSVTGFYTRQHNTIDYVRATQIQPWQAVNLSGPRFAGVETYMTWQAAKTQTIRLAWTTIYGNSASLQGLQSEYVFNYPVQNARTEWTAMLGHAMTLRNTVQIAQLYQRDPYPVWDLALTHDAGRVRPYVRLANLSNTGYQEIQGVAMPGRSIMAGISLQMRRKR